MFCTNCGKQLEYGAAFCNNCGAAAVSTAPPPAAPGVQPGSFYPGVKKRSPKGALIVVALIALAAAFVVWFTYFRPTNAFAESADVILLEGNGSIAGNDSIAMLPADSAGAGIGGNFGAAEPNGAALSTTERPGMSDFLWYTEGVFYDGMPADASMIDEFSQLTGNWKAYILYDPENTVGSYSFEYLNVNVAGDPGNVTLTFDWYKMYAGEAAEEYDYTDYEDTVIYGSFSEGGLLAGEPGRAITLYSFYSLNGKQYALGYFQLESGEPAYVAMVRP